MKCDFATRAESSFSVILASIIIIWLTVFYVTAFALLSYQMSLNLLLHANSGLFEGSLGLRD